MPFCFGNRGDIGIFICSDHHLESFDNLKNLAFNLFLVRNSFCSGFWIHRLEPRSEVRIAVSYISYNGSSNDVSPI